VIQSPKPFISAFYERRRRLAYAFGAAVLLLLVAQTHLGLSGETYADPRSIGGPALRIAHNVVSPGDDSGPGTRLLFLDAGLGIQKQLTFSGDARGILIEGEEITTFFGKGATVHRGENSVRHFELDQTWDVRSALLDSRGQAWIFGWNDGTVIARCRDGEQWSDAIPVRKSGKVDGLAALMDGEKGPLVAWSEAGTTIVKTAIWDGLSFVPRAEFDLGPADFWEIIATRGRILALSHRREDRTFRYVAIRLQCCKECGQPPPPERITFADPPLVFGRVVTGLTAVVSGDDLLVFLTRGSIVLARESSLQVGRAPIETLLPAPGARLLPVGSEALWRRIAGSLYPLAMLFCAAALVSLGFVMLRERSRVALARLRPPPPGPAIAAIVARLLAHALDLFILLPIMIVVADLLNWLPELRPEPLDPNPVRSTLFTTAFFLAYFVPMEGILGWTIGKKLLGLRVAGLSGGRAPFFGVVVRTLLRLVDMFPIIPIGLIVMAISKRRQRLGDLLGRTIVIQDRPPDPARKGGTERVERT
jgi:uncharacterized RDD family membrane protein YckC